MKTPKCPNIYLYLALVLIVLQLLCLLIPNEEIRLFNIMIIGYTQLILLIISMIHLLIGTIYLSFDLRNMSCKHEFQADTQITVIRCKKCLKTYYYEKQVNLYP